MTEDLFNEKLSNVITWIENALSVLFFGGMFGAIIIQVFFRYVLKEPLVWPYELSIFCFIYIVFFGAAIASRRGTHISFGLVLDRMSAKTRLVVTILTHIFIIIIILMIFPSTISFIGFMGIITSSAMGVPMYVVLLSFPVGMGLIVLYSIVWTIRYIHELRLARKG
jgi:TRAP-type C4-dicarboxylate transport system permease small subunit